MIKFRSENKNLGEWWNELEPQTKQHFIHKAAEIKEEHFKKNPGWKWSNKERKRFLNIL